MTIGGSVGAGAKPQRGERMLAAAPVDVCARPRANRRAPRRPSIATLLRPLVAAPRDPHVEAHATLSHRSTTKPDPISWVVECLDKAGTVHAN